MMKVAKRHWHDSTSTSLSLPPPLLFSLSLSFFVSLVRLPTLKKVSSASSARGLREFIQLVLRPRSHTTNAERQ